MSSAASPPSKKTPVAVAVMVCLRYWNKPDSLKRYLLIYNSLRSNAGKES